MPIYHEGVEVDRCFHAGVEAGTVIYMGAQIFPEPEIELPSTPVRMVQETDGLWFEYGWPSPELLDGNAADGWTDPGGYIRIRAARSEDLQTWDHQVVDAPDSPVANGDGTWTYWTRSVIPSHWESIMIDLKAESDRYGKSITGIQVFRAAVSLPHYPYAMPGQAATLQADLRAAGYTGATVAAVSGPLVATAKWHTQPGIKALYVTMSGTNVTNVTYQGSTVGSGYPFSMPSQKAALQTMLTAALGGDPNNKAIVMLHADTWTITLPDRTTTGTIRDLIVTITPDDPYPVWDWFGSYLGMMPATGVVGTPSNTRTPAGAPLEERARQFGRFDLSLGARYDA